ncbi:alpha-crystallin domain 32.1 [Abeliophyllum distichum]|uniref:Alpha-crystallin domain 32.1 n=1 Tax=Abeliophyllum distichum TaxID=126358 RepID=A0ABD1QK86_9LAMI
MEGQTVRRRVNMIAAHLASHEDISATATHVFPMSCSNSLNTVMRRCDNRMYFARQGSSSQACHMRQASSGQENITQPTMPLKSSGCANKFSNSKPPMFSRPSRMEPTVPNVRETQSAVQGCRYVEPSPEAPKFARPSRNCGQRQYQCKERRHTFESEFKWSPRMDVVESGRNYIATLELPGVNINSIKVEVNNQVLTVTGNRSIRSWKVDNCSNELSSRYHKREILQGPYHMTWSLPANVNKDAISAEFLDGLLRITMPKLLGYRGLRKAQI